jgi:prepilin-type N-terminal cleavage/methylation domain-containing protein
MSQVIQREPLAGSQGRAFTLVEIVVALTIVAVIAAVAIPTLRGLNRDEKSRAPMVSLAELIQEVRHRAMRERRSYQIVFEPGGIHASPAMYPYEKREDFLKHLEEMRTPPADAGSGMAVERQEVVRNGEPVAAAAARSRFEAPWTVSIPIEGGTECGVLMWGDGEWDILDGGKMRRWVFQPAGMSNPARVRLRHEDREVEAGFDVLTGELTSQRTALLTRQP